VRAALYRGDGHIGVEEIERPEPATGEVRVRVSVSGVDPTDGTDRRQSRLPADWAFKVVGDSALTCLPLTRFPLQDAAAAQGAVRGGTLGKVVIDVR
jgi:NADPH:quinone reductase-like Zn-dependent oxidoreductase